MKIDAIHLYRLSMPLKTPYAVSRKVFHEITPMVAEVRGSEGGQGWGEALITPGYTHESVEGGWDFCRNAASALIGMDPMAALAILRRQVDQHPCAASTLIAALEMLTEHEALRVTQTARIPLLAPCHAKDREALKDEVNGLIESGFATLKVKAGFDVDGDLARLHVIADAARGRAKLRIDANCGFSLDDARRYLDGLRGVPDVELLEQPCGAQDWDSNAEVARLSPVPVMLDESIYSLADIDRAASLPGVGFIKLKMKKTGGVELLCQALDHIHARGLLPVLGDGVSTEIGCWAEACAWRGRVRHAGEMNGFAKTRERLVQAPLAVEQGALSLEAGGMPAIDRAVLDAHKVGQENYTLARSGGKR